MWRSWTIGFFGVWIGFIPFLFAEGITMTLVLVVSGAFIATLSFSKLVSEQRERAEQLKRQAADDGRFPA